MNYRYTDDSDRERIRRKRIRRFKRRMKKLACICILLLFFVATIIGIVGIVKLMIYIFSDKNEEQRDTISYAIMEKFREYKSSRDGVTDNQEDEINEEQSAGSVKRAEPGVNGLIIIDAGHGGMDSGASYGDLVEKDINLAVSKLLKDELENRGYNVYMTRSDDSYVGLNERVRMANKKIWAKALVSIHQNSSENAPQASGVECWTYEREKCTELATCLTAAVSAATGARDRGVSYRKNLVITSKTTMPSVILECGYLSNEDDRSVLGTEDYQKKLVVGIADGIDNFLGTTY